VTGRCHRRDVLKGALAAPAMLLAPARSGDAGMIAPTGRLYGAAVRADTIAADPALRRRVAADCGWITPEIDFKWNALEYRRGGWWFERADQIAAFARTHDQQLRGHTLLWEQSTPDWARAEIADKRDWRLVERWFDGVLGRYADAASEWDVVNEPIDTEQGHRGLRRTCFQRAFGDGYVARALHAARERAPTARLFVNEYGLEYANPVERDRRTALLKLVERLRHDGAPIDGVGIQAHLDLSKGPLDTIAITAMLREIAGMGLRVSITELDVKEADRSLPLATRDRLIDDEVRRYLDVVLAEPAVRGVVSWGVSDRDSWLQDGIAATGPAALNRGLPLDAALAPKPVYWTLREAVGGGGGRHQV